MVQEGSDLEQYAGKVNEIAEEIQNELIRLAEEQARESLKAEVGAKAAPAPAAKTGAPAAKTGGAPVPRGGSPAALKNNGIETPSNPLASHSKGNFSKEKLLAGNPELASLHRDLGNKDVGAMNTGDLRNRAGKLGFLKPGSKLEFLFSELDKAKDEWDQQKELKEKGYAPVSEAVAKQAPKGIELNYGLNGGPKFVLGGEKDSDSPHSDPYWAARERRRREQQSSGG